MPQLSESNRPLDQWTRCRGRSERLFVVRREIYLTFSLEVMQGSIIDLHTLSEAMTGIDYVFHQAALPSFAFSLREPWLSNRVNVEGTLL